jgi:ribosome hibernation promoting factor
MLIEYTGRQTEVTPRLRGLAERRLRKLARVLRTITHAHVTFTADKHRRIAEVSVRSPHLVLTAQQETADMAASLATVLDKLERQAEKHAGKRKELKRRGPVRGTAASAPRRAGGVWKEPAPREPAPPAEPAPRKEREAPRPRLIRSRRVVPGLMTVQQAMVEVESSKDGLLVFRDAATERMTVLFKRKDGNLGLIEPEA